MKHILIFFAVFLNIIINGYGSTLKVTKEVNSFYTVNDKIELEVTISKKSTPETFILKEIKDFNLQNLKRINTAIRVITTKNEDKLLTSYQITFFFQAIEKGKAFIPEIEFLINSEMDEVIKTQEVDLEIISFLQKIKLPIQILIIMMIILIVAFSIYTIIKKKKNAIRKKQQMIIYKNQKIAAETQALKQFKHLGKHIIDGEYVQYSNEILKLFDGYFRHFVSFPQRYNSLEDYRTTLTPLLGKELNKQLAQFLNLIEEIQFAGKRPLKDDLNRIQLIAKEIIAKHRQNL